MRKRLVAQILLVVLLLCNSGRLVVGQLLTFPGAEGAGKYAAGGRGGDVYYVTNLNDSGTGSLRNGIATAPTAGRTILFKVSGTINLLSNLTIDKPKITIAGQSAPGGGITLAGRRTSVYNTSDVVLQYLRFRVGDTYTRGVDNSYEPDSLWIQGSSNVMVDHVSASWSVDEAISVTDGSDKVSVQWSVLSEALKDAGHPSGDHSYGSLINGKNITYAHNLYADNDSRNPRPQGNSGVGTSLYLDFVNNVIENPGGRYGYSGTGDTLHMNYVGNYGIDGPNTSASTLFEPDSSTTSIYFNNNYRDKNKNGILESTAATGTNQVIGTYNSSATRFDNGGALPAINSTDPRLAYIQVLSRAGAARYRDTVDTRIVRSVMNQTGAIIDSQNEVGGWPALPGGAAQTDTNNDGVPEWWAIANGLNPVLNNATKFAPDGYTYLEHYVQSLTPNAYPAANPQSTTISTAFGRGADAQVNENRDDNGVVSSTGFGTSANLNVRYTSTTGTRNEYSLLRFDLASVKPGSVADATLQLTAFRNMTSGEQVKVYGLIQDAAKWNWDEQSIEFATAPALTYDANPATRGLDANQLYTLGQISLSGEAEGSTISFNNANLAVFLNLAAYYEALPQDGLITLILERSNTSSGQSRFATKEATALESGVIGSFPAGAFAPRLVLSALANPVPLPGDYNEDNVVDAADYAVWRKSYLRAVTLPNEDATPGIVTIDDYNVWRANIGKTYGGSALGSGLGDSRTQVPEPSTFALTLILLWSAIVGEQRRRQAL